jgi:hypothetical protein
MRRNVIYAMSVSLDDLIEAKDGDLRTFTVGQRTSLVSDFIGGKNGVT